MRKIRISNLLLRKVINKSKQYGDYRFLDLYIRYENVMNCWGIGNRLCDRNLKCEIMKQKNGIQIVRWDFVMSQILKLKALKIADLRKMGKCLNCWVIVSHQFPLAGYGTVALANNAAHRIYRSPQSPTTASRRHDEDGYRFRAVVQQKSATTPEGIGEPLGLIRPKHSVQNPYFTN